MKHDPYSATAAGQAAQLRGAIEQVRRDAQRDACTVVDVLLRTGLIGLPFDDALAGEVAENCGAELLCDAARIARVLQSLGGAGGEDLVLLAELRDGREVALMADPWDDAVAAQVAARLSRYVEPVGAPGALLRDLGAGEPQPRDSADRATAPGIGDRTVRGSAVESDVVSFVDGAIESAYREGASDLHFECDRSGVTVKLRLDGVMSTLRRLNGLQQAEEVISRIKVLAQLDITERRLPQDGRIRYAAQGLGLDLRVSIMPSVFGEDAVLRLLDKSHLRAKSHDVTLDALGFDAADARRLRLLSSLPNGMLLVTGPTGSGKTTTVYAALSEINTGQEKIITIEDPVEYELPGVLQIPVNERKGLTFARGLRSILRHDPDRILVGEIRDAETAEIAVQAALTGHLVFTTVHANSLFDVIGRFRHFGIDMFGFVSSLNGVVVQRLMRRLCTACASERDVVADEADWLASLGVRDLPRVPAVTGCEQCHHTGYKGRFVIAEVHQVHDRFRDRVVGHADVSELKRLAFEDGNRPLVRQAVDRVRDGRTSLEEVFRVVGQV